MKAIYIDITNIPELKRYTGISRVVSEIAVKMICDGVDVRLISYAPKHHAYRLIDNDRFQLASSGMLPDKKQCYTDTYIPVDEMEAGSVFFDVNSSWHTLPNRSWLLPRLKKGGRRHDAFRYRSHHSHRRSHALRDGSPGR